MSRELDSEEVAKLVPIIAAAVLEASYSLCQKSKRGVVIYKDGVLLGRGHNSPKDQKLCIMPICYEQCSEYCDHAEKNAFKDAKRRGNDVQGATMLHIKVEHDEVKVSDKPSCIKCSPLVAASDLNEFILYTNSGCIAYGAQEFHEETQKNLGIKK